MKPTSPILKTLGGSPSKKLLTDLTAALRETTAAIYVLNAQLADLAQAAKTAPAPPEWLTWPTVGGVQ